MDLELSEMLKSLEEGIIKGRFINDKIKEVEMVLYLNGVCVSKRCSW